MKLSTIINDSIHGDIKINEEITVKIINTPEFQRLKFISQLAGGQFIFTNASHTRFSHCIGVYYLVGKILETSNFKKKYNKDKQLLVKLAGLLHDIGHGPFSHTFEIINKITKKNISHENYSSLLIKNKKTNINKILLKKFSVDEINELCMIIEGKHPDIILSSLVSSQLDADRMDYLLRDMQISNLDYNNIDIHLIINNLFIKENKIIFSSKIQHEIETFLIVRYYMYNKIYLHPLNIGFDLTFKMLFKRLYDLYHDKYKFKNNTIIILLTPVLQGKMMNPKQYCLLNDYTLFKYLKILESENDEILVTLIKMLINHTFFIKINSTKIKLKKIKKKLIKKYNNHYNYFMVKYILKPVKLYDSNIKPIYIDTPKGIKCIMKVSKLLLFKKNNKKSKTIIWFSINNKYKKK